MVLSRHLGQEGERGVLNGSAEEDEKVLESDGGYGCTGNWMYLVPQHCSL